MEKTPLLAVSLPWVVAEAEDTKVSLVGMEVPAVVLAAIMPVEATRNNPDPQVEGMVLMVVAIPVVPEPVAVAVPTGSEPMVQALPVVMVEPEDITATFLEIHTAITAILPAVAVAQCMAVPVPVQVEMAEVEPVETPIPKRRMLSPIPVVVAAELKDTIQAMLVTAAQVSCWCATRIPSR
jgi:hypothetical protein